MGEKFKFQCIADESGVQELGYAFKEYLHKNSVPLADSSLYLTEDKDGNQLIVRHLSVLSSLAEVYLPKEGEAVYVWATAQKGVDKYALDHLEKVVESLKLKKSYERRIEKLEAYEDETLWRITKGDLSSVIGDSEEETRDLPGQNFEELCQLVRRDFNVESWSEELSMFVEMKK